MRTLSFTQGPLVWVTAAFLGTTSISGLSSAQTSYTHEEASPLATPYPPEAILGEWTTQAEENRPPARVRFQRAHDGTYLGFITWTSVPKKDVHNNDPKLRDRSVVGIVILWNLRYENGEYVDGYVYNPEDGGTYRVETEVKSPESMNVRGYVGISLFGQTKTWTRYHST
jgi:uncharacterized protein (DUF2147 family)